MSTPSDPLEIIGQWIAAEKLEGLLIGGYAVNFHGYSRMTKDIDFVIRRVDLEKWRSAASQQGYEVRHDGGNFIQFDGPPATPDLDPMLVNESTFEKLSARSAAVDATGIKAVCAEHLIALKLHALKHSGEHRAIKDFMDIVEIVAANRIDLKSEEMRLIFHQYGTPDLTRRIMLACEPDE